MKCKRCGEPLDPMDTRCPVCGRTVPPRKNATPQKKNETAIKLPQLDKFTHAYSRDAARSRMMQLLTVAVLAAAVVLLVLVYTGVGTLREAVGQLQLTADAQLQALERQPDPVPETTPREEDPTDPPVQETQPPAARPLSRQTLEATLTLDASRGEPYAGAWMTLESADDRAVSWVHTGSGLTGAVWMLENAGDRLEVELRQRQGESRTELSLEWATAGVTFSALEGAVCIWECRAGGGEWESLPLDCVTMSPAEGMCQVALTMEQRATLQGQYDALELRCHLSLQHPDGGSLKLLAAGITLAD